MTAARGELQIYVAMIHRMSRFGLPDKNQDDDIMRRPSKAVKS